MFVPAKMVHKSDKSIKAKNVLGKTFSKKTYNRKITKKTYIPSGIGCITCGYFNKLATIPLLLTT